MTKQESFKRRIRERMEKTGERYAEARRVLITQTSSQDRPWVSLPEMSDNAVSAATGRSWNEWCELIERWPGHSEGHQAIATYLEAEQDLDGWWSQAVTIGFERITGLRLPHQMADGTFTANKSRTITVDGQQLRTMLLDENARTDLFPGESTNLTSKPSAKNIRIAIGGGSAQIAIAAAGNRTKITIQHSRLATFDDVERWKFYWSDWLDTLERESATP